MNLRVKCLITSSELIGSVKLKNVEIFFKRFYRILKSISSECQTDEYSAEAMAQVVERGYSVRER